jgi:uncharacterized protein YjbJ (UPF0337 family)
MRSLERAPIGTFSGARRRGRDAIPSCISNGGRKPWFRNENWPRFTGKYAGSESATDSENAGCFGLSATDALVFPIQKNTARMKEIAMNKDQAAGGWKELKGKIKQQWGKLTDDDLTVLEGSADELSGKIQKRYGIAKEEAEKQIKSFRDTNTDLVSRW